MRIRCNGMGRGWNVARKYVMAAMAGMMALMLPGCYVENEVDEGFPRTVDFPAEGGVKEISGFKGIVSLEILGGETSSTEEVEDNIEIVKSCWLTVEYEIDSPKMTLTARSAEPEEPRHLKIKGYVHKDYVVINVKI